MFSTRLSRAGGAVAPSLSSTTSSAAARSTQCLATRPTHQRRHSSSTKSAPPDSGKPAPAAKASNTDEASTSPASAPTQHQTRKKRPRGMAGPRVQNLVAQRMGKVPKSVDHFAGLLPVPELQGLNEKDLSLSSFFSMHRPLSVAHTIPPPSSTETFNSIFQAKNPRDPWENGNSAERRPEDVIYTLHNTIESLENQSSASQDEGVRWEVLQESPSNQDGVKHLDGAPRMKSLDELVAQFKPFRAPPPPQPFPEEQKVELKKASRGQRKQQLLPRLSQKSYQTVVTILETSSPNGRTSYSATSSPITLVNNPGSTTQSATISEPTAKSLPQIRQPFLERMRRRQQLYLQAQHGKVLARMGETDRPFVRRAPSARRVEMILISVKRQRKLKMKKHKYKKLMKRTRNLRRRLDRT